jgi:hypothetical protein
MDSFVLFGALRSFLGMHRMRSGSQSDIIEESFLFTKQGGFSTPSKGKWKEGRKERVVYVSGGVK